MHVNCSYLVFCHTWRQAELISIICVGFILEYGFCWRMLGPLNISRWSHARENRSSIHRWECAWPCGADTGRQVASWLTFYTQKVGRNLFAPQRQKAKGRAENSCPGKSVVLGTTLQHTKLKEKYCSIMADCWWRSTWRPTVLKCMLSLCGLQTIDMVVDWWWFKHRQSHHFATI